MMQSTTELQRLNNKWGRKPYPTDPPRSEVRHGCTCHQVTEDGKHVYDLGVDSACAYHRYAAQHPDDHRSPWNCPTYWDGCNCPDWERITRNVIAKQRQRRGHRVRPDRGARRPHNPFW